MKTLSKKNSEILVLSEELEKMSKMQGVQFTYALTRTHNNLKSIVKALQESVEEPEKYKEYAQKGNEIRLKHSSGKTNHPNGMVEFQFEDEAKVLAQKEFDELNEEYKDTIEERDNTIKAYEILLEEESEFQAFMIKLEYIPESITKEQMDLLIDLIYDNE